MPIYRGTPRLKLRRPVVVVGGGASAYSFSVLTAPAPDTTTQTTYTSFTSAALGPADANRYIGLCIMSRNSTGTQAVSTATVGGVSCSQVVSVLNGTADIAAIYVTTTPVASGTTGDIVVTFAGANQRCAVQQFAIISPGIVVPSGGAIGTSIANAGTATITIPSSGNAIGCSFSLGGGPGTPSATPAGFNNLDLNSNIAGTQEVFAFHSTGISGSQTLTMTLASASSTASVFAAWGP